MFDRIARKIHAWRVEQATNEELSRLSDAQLDDIGLRRDDIASVARRSTGL